MNGVFGVADSRGRGSLAGVLDAMAAALTDGGLAAAVQPDANAALGHSSLGTPHATEATTSGDGRVSVVFHGTLWNEDALRQHLAHAREPLRAAHVEELILGLYLADGPGFPRQLNGEFAVAVADHARGAVLVATDPLGMYPTYWAERDGRLYFAPSVRAVLAALPRPTLDLTALAQYMRFQQLLGERTFFEDVRLIPRGTVLRFGWRDGRLALTPYATWADLPAARHIAVAEATEEIGALLHTAVRRRSAASRIGLFLTGGLDSRLLLAALRRDGRAVRAYTYGCGDSRDVVYARRVARGAGVPHHWHPITDGRWVETYAAAHLDRSEGFHPWLHGHGINVLETVRGASDLLFTGWGGGTVVGGWLNFFDLPAATRDDADLLAGELFHWLTRYATWPSLGEAEEHVLYAPALAPRLRGRAFASLREELTAYMAYREDLRAELFFFDQHDFRFLQPWTTMLRAEFPTATPYLDLDLCRGVYALPARIRGYRVLMRALLQRWAPRLALIPYDRDDRLPTTIRPLRSAHHWAGIVAHKVNAHVARVFPEHRTLALDYVHWTRTDLRAWAEDLLLGERTRARGLFRPNILQSLWQRLQSGNEPNVIGKIAPIMTYELMLRRFYDAR